MTARYRYSVEFWVPHFYADWPEEISPEKVMAHADKDPPAIQAMSRRMGGCYTAAFLAAYQRSLFA